MAILEVQCIPAPEWATPPSISIPHFGILEMMQDGLGDIPDPMDILLKFQNMLAVALAPVRRFLEIVEAFMAVKNCITAIPTAIMRLSPGPIFDCLEQLAKTLARILSWIPPMSYVRLEVDLLRYCIGLVNGVIDFFVRLDGILDDYIAAFDLATSLGDVDLLQFVNCSIGYTRSATITAMDALRFIKPINDVLMQMFLRLMPSEAMRKAAEDYANAGDFMDTASTAMKGSSGQTPLPPFPGGAVVQKVQHAIVPIPPISPLLQGLSAMGIAMSTIYNILAPLVGEEPSITIRSIPELQHI